MVRTRSRSRGRSLSTSSSVTESASSAVNDKNNDDSNKTNDDHDDIADLQSKEEETSPNAVVVQLESVTFEKPQLQKAVDNGHTNDNEDGGNAAAVVEKQESVVEKETEEDGDDEDNEQEDLIELKSTLDSSRTTNSSGTFKEKHSRERSMSKGKFNTATNTLTDLIPGYTAPLALDSSSLDKFRPTGGIRALQRRAEQTDASTKNFVAQSGVKNEQAAVEAMKQTRYGTLPQSYTASYSSFKKGIKRTPDPTAGGGWFNMKPSAMTEELKTDLAVIRNRSYLDPKRFYKNADKHHAIVQLGTVMEGPTEYYSSRLTKKQRRSNLTEELMADPTTAQYAQRKFQDMSREKSHQANLRKQQHNKKKKGSRKFY